MDDAAHKTSPLVLLMTFKLAYKSVNCQQLFFGSVAVLIKAWEYRWICAIANPPDSPVQHEAKQVSKR
jgi:hypothetical protein